MVKQLSWAMIMGWLLVSMIADSNNFVCLMWSL